MLCPSHIQNAGGGRGSPLRGAVTSHGRHAGVGGGMCDVFMTPPCGYGFCSSYTNVAFFQSLYFCACRVGLVAPSSQRSVDHVAVEEPTRGLRMVGGGSAHVFSMARCWAGGWRPGWCRRGYLAPPPERGQGWRVWGEASSKEMDIRVGQ